MTMPSHGSTSSGGEVACNDGSTMLLVILINFNIMPRGNIFNVVRSSSALGGRTDEETWIMYIHPHNKEAPKT